MALGYTIVSYEGDAWVAYSKPHAWRWQTESAIHLDDGRTFATLDDARAANGPVYVEVRAADTAAGLPAVQAFPTIAAYVRSLYLTYFGREPDSGGHEFWTNEIATGRNTQDGVRTIFINDPEAKTYAARVRTSPPAVTGAQPPAAVSAGGFLNSKVFGVDVKLLILGGVVAYFVMGDK